jgi:hypothetical protein
MANPPRCVSELIEDGISMKWRLDVIQKYLYNMDAKIYSFIYVGKMIFFFARHRKRCGIFSVESDYRMLVYNQNQIQDWLDGRVDTSDNEAGEVLKERSMSR